MMRNFNGSSSWLPQLPAMWAVLWLEQRLACFPSNEKRIEKKTNQPTTGPPSHRGQCSSETQHLLGINLFVECPHIRGKLQNRNKKTYLYLLKHLPSHVSCCVLIYASEALLMISRQAPGTRRSIGISFSKISI